MTFCGYPIDLFQKLYDRARIHCADPVYWYLSLRVQSLSGGGDAEVLGVPVKFVPWVAEDKILLETKLGVFAEFIGTPEDTEDGQA